jgi:phage-related holin
MKKPFYYWFAVFFYAAVIFFSNFGETQIVNFYPYGFGYWFVVMFFATCLGFIISYLFGLRESLWIILITFLGISVISALLGIIKPVYLKLDSVSLANVVLQILKIGLSSVFGILGVLIWQNIFLSKELVRAEEKIKFYERNVLDAKKEAEVLIKEAEIKANEIIFDAKKKVQELEKLKRDLEVKIREFLQIELAVLDKHEENLKD